MFGPPPYITRFQMKCHDATILLRIRSSNLKMPAIDRDYQGGLAVEFDEARCPYTLNKIYKLAHILRYPLLRVQARLVCLSDLPGCVHTYVQPYWYELVALEPRLILDIHWSNASHCIARKGQWSGTCSY